MVAVHADKIVGFCIGQSYLQEGRQTGHIITIDVLPASRREGTGRLLFRAVEEHFRVEGAVVMQLEVAADNHPAQSFYQAMGYEQISKLPGYYNNKLDAVVMEKQLSVA